jgi:hypothetical protein
MRFNSFALAIPLIFVLASCSNDKDMQAVIHNIKAEVNVADNPFATRTRIEKFERDLERNNLPLDIKVKLTNELGNAYLEIGDEKRAVKLWEDLLAANKQAEDERTLKNLAMAYMRLAERTNCVTGHMSESCIVPIRGLGIHKDESASRKAIVVYEKILTRNRYDLESRWLLNLAYMTLGEYPAKVPPAFLIPEMEGDTTMKVNAFVDIAADLKLDVNNMAGGVIVDDFNNDGLLDIMNSGWDLDEPMHLFMNKGNGTFSDNSSASGIDKVTGGLNIQQTDFNNDGFKDVFVLRGAWKVNYGNEPNALLKNNGDGTFTDVTIAAGLLSFHPTQTATWNDFNGDGWVDVFIGNETIKGKSTQDHPCELYMNNQDGTFREVASKANCDIVDFVKAVSSGDFDNDGLADIFMSSMEGTRRLLKNEVVKNGDVYFKDVTIGSGLDKHHGKTFPGWFWDYNNDGWLDIFTCDYTFENSLAFYEAAEKIKFTAGSPEKMLLYRNNHDGTFTNVANDIGLNTNAFAMGSNFGDIDNDGFLDMYLATGNPMYQSLVPNKMFKNIGGEKFADVTRSARVGHLQKGHGVSFADLDNDGDQDIYTDLGGAFLGDAYPNTFHLNPGQENNGWICIELEGTKANRAAIGSRITLTITENGKQRKIYRDVNSGGSFGSSPLRREIGIGKATIVDEIKIQWAGSNTVQVFKNVKGAQFYKVKEGVDVITPIMLKTIVWTLPFNRLCEPVASVR